MAGIIFRRTSSCITTLLTIAILAFGCSRSTSSSGDAIDHGSSEFPMEFEFDGPLAGICADWNCGACQAAHSAAAAFEFDSTSGRVDSGCMLAHCESGFIVADYQGKMYFEGSLELKTRLDFREADSITLRFYDHRDIVQYWPLPQLFAGQQNDSRCHVEASTDGGTTWIKLRTFEVGAPTWTLETIHLEQLAGKSGVSLRYVVHQHASKDVATRWWIDDVRLTVK